MEIQFCGLIPVFLSPSLIPVFLSPSNGLGFSRNDQR
jgi:hypothetical protein